MSSLSSLRQELDLLKKQKVEAQRKNHAEAAKYGRSYRRDVDVNNHEALSVESTHHNSIKDLPLDPMDWTAEQWARVDKFQMQASTSASASGYKDLTGLAYATYAKETAEQTVDLEKYEKSKNAGSSNSENVPAPENVDAVVKRLQEASNRKQKRRTDTKSDKQYVNEKNRQFNMKLDREYGGK